MKAFKTCSIFGILLVLIMGCANRIQNSPHTPQNTKTTGLNSQDQNNHAPTSPPKPQNNSGQVIKTMPIDWRPFIPETFVDECMQAAQKLSNVEEPIDWSTVQNTFWLEAQNLKNRQQEAFWNKLNAYTEIALDIEALNRRQATYIGLTQSLQTLEKSKASLKSAFLKSLEEIDTTIIVANRLKVSTSNATEPPSEKIAKMEQQIDQYVKMLAPQRAVWMIERQKVVKAGSLLQDVIFASKTDRVESYPSDPIFDFEPQTSKTGYYYLVKAVRVFPRAQLRTDAVFSNQMRTTPVRACKTCTIVDLEFADIPVTLQQNTDLKQLCQKVKQHNTSQKKLLATLSVDYEKQIEHLNKQIQRYKAAQKKVVTELAAMKMGERYDKAFVPDSYLHDSDFKQEGLDRLIDSLSSLKKTKEGELNALFKKGERINYTLSRQPVPKHKTGPAFFKFLINPSDTKSTPHILLNRLKDLKQISVTVIENGQLKHIQGKEYYRIPSIENITHYALFGPHFTFMPDHPLNHQLTYILGVKVSLSKAECPDGSPKGIFPEASYHDATKSCSPCQLPMLEDMLSMQALPQGYFWTREKKGGMVKVLVKGKTQCDHQEKSIMSPAFFERKTTEIGFLLQDPTSSANFVCTDN